ncbi:hypothetical protein F3J44_08400 [Pantoea sp. Tr-811]|nr:hypothetical protein [Pantoea sp. Tr-811]
MFSCRRGHSCIGRSGPFAGQARSYRCSTCLKVCGFPVGAGLPAKGPDLPSAIHSTANPPLGKNNALFHAAPSRA